MRTIYREGYRVKLIDQTRLPAELLIVDCETASDIGRAIQSMQIRGAPAIGVAGAYGVALAASEGSADPAVFAAQVRSAGLALRNARPTAVNLAWAVDQALECFESLVDRASAEVVRTALWDLADALAEADVATNHRIGENGAVLIPDGARILTHCNAGALATVDWGTALGVVRSAVERGTHLHVLVDETRPFLQGARLTAWELQRDHIPYTIIADNMAGYLMSQGEVDLCLVGADRVASNGDVANKIGTYSLSVLARAHQIPFYVAAPLSSVDLRMRSGADIPIEERSQEEVLSIGGVRIAPIGAAARHPAFDITPAANVTALVTEEGVLGPPYDRSLADAVKRARGESITRRER